MPGLVGFIDSASPDKSGKLISTMANALAREDCFNFELYQHEGVGLGRISLGVVNSEKQPLWNKDGTICTIMEGELYASDQLKKMLIAHGHQIITSSDAELVLHLYEELGEEFALNLNGSFAIAIWDKQSQKLLLATDRIGQFPLYFVDQGKAFFFASGVRALLVDPKVGSAVDHLGIAQFLTFEHPLGTKTFFKDIHRLPPASMLKFQNGTIKCCPYWTLQNPEEYALREEEEWMEELNYHLLQAVSRCVDSTRSTGLLLSGGLDSRILLAYLNPLVSDGALSTITWGSKKCDDYRIAKKLSELVGVRNSRYPLKADWLIDHAEEGVRITDGMGNIVNLHAMSVLPAASDTPVVYKGFLGDGLLGYILKHQHWSNYDETTRIRAHLQVHREQGAILFEPEAHSGLFKTEFQEQLGGSIMQSYKEAMDESESNLLADQRYVFSLRQRVPRMALNGVEVLRDKMFVRLPFCDNDLVEFAASIPPGLLYKRRLVKNAFVYFHPELAKVPLTETGLPMMECAREILLRAENTTRWHLNRRGFNQVQYPRKRPYADYNNWFRHELKDWMMGILTDSEFEKTDYFSPVYVRNLLDEHLAGENHAGRIGALLTVALWHRMYVG